MKFEYMVLYIDEENSGPDSLQARLNELAQDDWRVICYCPQGLILVHEMPGSLSSRVAQAIAMERLRSQPVDSWVVAPEPAQEN